MKKMLLRVFVIILFILVLKNPIYADDQNEDLDFTWVEETIQTSAKGQNKEPTTYSKAVVAFDRNSKTVIYGKNENKVLPMASTTKIMTAIIFLENVPDNKLNEDVEVCKEAATIRGSRLGLKEGDKITYNDLLYSLMLCSGNDAAVQIAYSIAGNVKNFSELMNKKAEELNLQSTNFTTPHGLDDNEHYTTAYELSLICDYALNIKKFADIVKTKSYTVSINGYPKTIFNTNELLEYLNRSNWSKNRIYK